MSKTISYWHDNATFQQEYNDFFNSMVAKSGPADTLAGELIRAVSRLNYDYFNNGMCNNTSGACLFLKDQYMRGVRDHEVDNSATDLAWANIYYESNTGGYTSVDLEKDLTILTDAVVEYIILLHGNYASFAGDLFDYQEPDYEYELWDADECEY